MAYYVVLPQKLYEGTGAIYVKSLSAYVLLSRNGRKCRNLRLCRSDLLAAGINPLKAKLGLFYLKIQFVPRSKHTLSRI